MERASGHGSLRNIERAKKRSCGINQMKKHKIVVGLYFFAGGMWILVALRDIFAPGFLSFNGRVISRSQIIFELAVALVFLSIGVMSIKRRHVDAIESKQERR